MSGASDEYMTVAEVAAILKLNQQTVRNWIDAGKLPAVRLGRRVRIKRSDFDQLLAEGYTGATTSKPEAEPNPPRSIWDGEVPPPGVGG